ncbi:MAG: hypothetical protein JRI25_28095, partial [Deltaproteobacteria bacterium]|nr:hypothetical protein [Deltaproteobacteria bacterium]
MKPDPTHRAIDIAAPVATTGTRRAYSLPDDLVDESIRRVGHIAAILAILMAANIVVTYGFVVFSSTIFDLPFTSLLSRLALVLLSAGMYFAAKSP